MDREAETKQLKLPLRSSKQQNSFKVGHESWKQSRQDRVWLPGVPGKLYGNSVWPLRDGDSHSRLREQLEEAQRKESIQGSRNGIAG